MNYYTNSSKKLFGRFRNSNFIVNYHPRSNRLANIDDNIVSAHWCKLIAEFSICIWFDFTFIIH